MNYFSTKYLVKGCCGVIISSGLSGGIIGGYNSYNKFNDNYYDTTILKTSFHVVEILNGILYGASIGILGGITFPISYPLLLYYCHKEKNK